MTTPILMAGDELARIVGAVHKAASKDGGRPALAGIHFHVEGKEITAVACDGYRLSESSAALMEEAETSRRVILEIKPLLAFLKLLSKKPDVPVMIAPDDGVWNFRQFGASLGVPVIDATFPDYKKIIGGDPEELFSVNAKYLRDVLSAHGQEMVSIGRGAGSKAGAAFPVSVTQKDTHTGGVTRHVVMPMVVKA